MQQRIGVRRSEGMVVQEIEVQTKGEELSGFLFSCPNRTSFALYGNYMLAHCEAA